MPVHLRDCDKVFPGGSEHPLLVYTSGNPRLRKWLEEQFTCAQLNGKRITTASFVAMGLKAVHSIFSTLLKYIHFSHVGWGSIFTRGDPKIFRPEQDKRQIEF